MDIILAYSVPYVSSYEVMWVVEAYLGASDVGAVVGLGFDIVVGVLNVSVLAVAVVFLGVEVVVVMSAVKLAAKSVVLSELVVH